MLNNSVKVFVFNSSSGTGQFARMSFAVKQLSIKNHRCVWLGPNALSVSPRGVDAFECFDDLFIFFKERNIRYTLIFSSETDFIRSLFWVRKFKKNSQSCQCVFMQRIDTLENYLFNFRHNRSPVLLLRILLYPFIMGLSYRFIDLYVFQSHYAVKSYFFRNVLISSIFFIFKTKRKVIKVLPNNSGVAWKNCESAGDLPVELLNDPKNKIVYIGNLQYFGKGLNILFDAFKDLPKSSYSLCLVGSWPKEWRNIISDRIRSLKAEGYDVYAPGHVKHPQSWLLGHNSLYVAPSNLDLSPNSLLEVLGIDVPVVASDIDAHKFILGDHRLLFMAGNSRSLASKIINIFSNSSDLKYNKSICRQCYFDFDFDWGEELSKIISLYD